MKLSHIMREKRIAKKQKLLSLAELKTFKAKMVTMPFYFTTPQMDAMWRATVSYAAILRSDKAPLEMQECILKLCAKLMTQSAVEVHKVALDVDEFHIIDKALELWAIKEETDTALALINFFHEGKTL